MGSACRSKNTGEWDAGPSRNQARNAVVKLGRLTNVPARREDAVTGSNASDVARVLPGSESSQPCRQHQGDQRGRRLDVRAGVCHPAVGEGFVQWKLIAEMGRLGGDRAGRERAALTGRDDDLAT